MKKSSPQAKEGKMRRAGSEQVCWIAMPMLSHKSLYISFTYDKLLTSTLRCQAWMDRSISRHFKSNKCKETGCGYNFLTVSTIPCSRVDSYDKCFYSTQVNMIFGNLWVYLTYSSSQSTLILPNFGKSSALVYPMNL